MAGYLNKRMNTVKIGRRVLDWWKRSKYSGRDCFYCGTALTFGNGVPVAATRSTTDHVIPRSRQGKDGKHNTVKCCRLCNESKANKTLDVFRRSFSGGEFFGELTYREREI